MSIDVNDFLGKLGAYVQDNTSVGTVGINIYYGYLPAEDQAGTTSAVAIIDTGGPGTPGLPTVHRQFQVLVRDSDNHAAREAVTAIHVLFDDVVADLDNCKMGGMKGRFQAMHLPGPHMFDQNGDIVYAINYDFLSNKQYCSS